MTSPMTCAAVQVRNTLVHERVEDGEDVHCHSDELTELKNITLNATAVSILSTTQLAGVLAAYLADYSCEIEEEFNVAKKCLVNFFKDNLIRGAVLVDAEEEDVREIMDDKIDVVCENASNGWSRAKRSSVKVLVSSFIERIRNDADDAA